MTELEEQQADEAFAALANEPSLRSIVDDLVVRVSELSYRIDRIEVLLQSILEKL